MPIQKRFIVVDDDPINNLVCKHVILKFNQAAEITLFTNPEEALAMVQTLGNSADNGIIVLFLDINMPGMSGWEFLEAFESLDEKIHNLIHIYILSSSIYQGDIDRAAAGRFVKGYYLKPLSVEALELLNFRSDPPDLVRH